MENPYELLYMTRMKDPYAENALLRQYEPIIRHLQKQLSAMHYDVNVSEEELRQEGRISFFHAVKTYRADKCASFYTYCTVVVRRGMNTCLRHYGCGKYLRAGDFVYMSAANGSGISVADTLRAGIGMSDPEYRQAYMQAAARLQQIMHDMKEQEKRVLALWQNDVSYDEGAKILGLSRKGYDAALQRLRRKLRTILTEGD